MVSIKTSHKELHTDRWSLHFLFLFLKPTAAYQPVVRELSVFYYAEYKAFPSGFTDLGFIVFTTSNSVVCLINYSTSSIQLLKVKVYPWNTATLNANASCAEGTQSGDTFQEGVRKFSECFMGCDNRGWETMIYEFQRCLTISKLYFI